MYKYIKKNTWAFLFGMVMVSCYPVWSWQLYVYSIPIIIAQAWSRFEEVPKEKCEICGFEGAKLYGECLVCDKCLKRILRVAFEKYLPTSFDKSME